jgi:hypothetical protein
MLAISAIAWVSQTGGCSLRRQQLRQLLDPLCQLKAAQGQVIADDREMVPTGYVAHAYRLGVAACEPVIRSISSSRTVRC